MFNFEAKIIDVFMNVKNSQKPDILILDKSAVYPTSGGQEHDTATIQIPGVTEIVGNYEITDAVKVGKCVLHYLDRPLEGDYKLYLGRKVKVQINKERRLQLMSHHTGTHIMFAACRKVLGPHIWQNGAKKTEEMAHLDITHYKSLTKDEETQIENEANRIIN